MAANRNRGAMSDDRIEVKIDIFDKPEQVALVLKKLTVQELLGEILQEFREDFAFLDVDNPGFYEIYPKDRDVALDVAKSLSSQVKHGAALVLRERPFPIPTGAKPMKQTVYLKEMQTQKVFKLGWLPAIIGRPDAAMNDDHLLAVNLQTFSTGLRVSRRHAQIVERSGKLYLESLSQNPTCVGDRTLTEGDRYPLNPDDEIILEKGNITLKVIIRDQSTN